MLLKSLSTHQKRYSIFNKFAIFEAPKSVLLTVCTILTASVLCLYSSSGGAIEPWAFKQIIFITISFTVFYVIISVNIKIIYKFSYISMICVIILLLAVIPFGKRVLGASRWLDFGVFMVQPSEYAKVAVILVLAKFFSNINVKRIKNFSTTVVAFIIILPIFTLVVLQPDLATSIIIVSLTAIMLFVAGVPLWEFILAGSMVIVSAPIVWIKLLKDYQKLRIINFLFPESDPLGSGYNIIQSKIAVGSGGFLGKGFLEGTQGRLRFLPEHHTDFIFTIVGEEFGFVGAVALILLYLYIVFYGFTVARNTNSTFYKLVATDCASLILLHIFVNIGMTVALMPVAGIPLIMFSYGGSSLMIGLICIAIIINIDINKNVI